MVYLRNVLYISQLQHTCCILFYVIFVYNMFWPQKPSSFITKNITRESKFVGIYVKEWDFFLDIGYFLYTSKLIFCVYSYGDICDGFCGWNMLYIQITHYRTWNVCCDWQMFFITILNQKSIPLGYLHVLVQGAQSPLLCFLESLQLKKLME